MCVAVCRGRSARIILNFLQVLESQLFQKNIFAVLVFVFTPWRLLCECVLRRVTEGEIGLYRAGNKPDTVDCRIHKRRRLQYPSTASSHPPYCSFPAPSPSASRVRLIHLKPTSPPLIGAFKLRSWLRLGFRTSRLLGTLGTPTPRPSRMHCASAACGS